MHISAKNRLNCIQSKVKQNKADEFSQCRVSMPSLSKNVLEIDNHEDLHLPKHEKFTWNVQVSSDTKASLQELEVPIQEYPWCFCCWGSQSENLQIIKLVITKRHQIWLHFHYHGLFFVKVMEWNSLLSMFCRTKWTAEFTLTTIMAITPQTIRNRNSMMHLSVATFPKRGRGD